MVDNMDTLTKAERSKRMSLIRGKDTKPELAVRRLLELEALEDSLEVLELEVLDDSLKDELLDELD